MEILFSVAGLFLGIISVIMTWHFGTKNRRLAKKVEQHRQEVDVIKAYSKTTGYKNILHDSFHVFSYAGAVFLCAFSLQTIVPFLTLPEFIANFVGQIAAGFYMGVGLVLWTNFRMLSAAYKPDKAVLELNEKIKKINGE